MLVEMASNDKLEDNITSPIEHSVIPANLFVCLPTSISQGVVDPAPLGGMVGISKVEEILTKSRFSKVGGLLLKVNLDDNRSKTINR